MDMGLQDRQRRRVEQNISKSFTEGKDYMQDKDKRHGTFEQNTKRTLNQSYKKK